MPATSSRRKATRRNVMSDIEDDVATQRFGQDDVEESDGGQTSRGVRKMKGKKRVQEHIDNNPDSDSDEAIDVDNFPDQPLKREQMIKLHGLAEDWQKLAEAVSRPFDKYGLAAGALADLGDNDAKVRVEEIDGYMRESLDFVGVIKAHVDSLTSIRQDVVRGEKIVEVGEVYVKNAKANVSNYKNRTTRQKYAKQEVYVAFKASIWESQHPGTPMPPITEEIAREQGDNSEEDEDLEVGGVSQNYMCPITLTLLDDPYTSGVCGHSFSAVAIKATFRTPGSLNKCPSTGCNKSFRLVDCKPNKNLAKKVKAHKRRMEREQDDSDAEEVVD